MVAVRDGDDVKGLLGLPLNGGTSGGDDERPNASSATVTSPRYVTCRQEQEAVRAREGDCHVETVHLTAELARAGSE